MREPSLAQIEKLFQAAADLEPSRRREFLDEHCAGNAALRQRVEAMLAQLDQNESLVHPSLSSVDESSLEGPGSVIGRYQLLEVLGEGGFGVVYMAEQQEPVVRKVALKVIKLGMDTKEVVARFEAERQALALMDHPHIARVLDGGATDAGRPYFVMELVRGVAITEYCDTNQLGMAERLELFVSVCQAVQHAHQKGVIHRDIKPSNVMVTLHDGRPIVKVIDFGIAKAVNRRLTEKTLFTRYQQFVGTPAYMSPEQAEMSAVDVDTRTDVYALGVLLYELLTGTTPFDTQSLWEEGFSEMQRVIREVPPQRPSQRISTTSDATVAHRRQHDVATLSRNLRGDLDWIVMKALEKERGRRYGTASDFAADVNRHLRHEPVLAGPPGAGYRMRKFFARHRAAAVSVGLLVLAIVGGFVGTTIGFLEASRQRDVARKEAANVRSVTEFFVETLALANPVVAMEPDPSVRVLLDRTAVEVEDAFRGQPEGEARVRSTMGRAYSALSEHELAEIHLRRAIELIEDLPNFDQGEYYATLWAQTEVAFRLQRGDAFSWARRARAVGHDHVRGTFPAAAASLDEFHDSVEQAAHKLDTAGIHAARKLCTPCYELVGKQVPPGHPFWTIIDDTFLATGYWLWYTPHEAISADFFGRALEIRERELPKGHPDTHEALSLLAGVLNRSGRAEEATDRIRESVIGLRRVFPRGSFRLANAEAMLGENLSVQGQFEEAEKLILDSHEGILAVVKDELNFYSVDSYGRLVGLYSGWERWDEARKYQDVLTRIHVRSPYLNPWPLVKIVFGPEHRALIQKLDQLHEAIGGISYGAGPGMLNPTGIGPMLNAAVEEQRSMLGVNDPLSALVARLFVSWSSSLQPGEQDAHRRLLCDAAVETLEAWRDTIPLDFAVGLSHLAEVTATQGQPDQANDFVQRAGEAVESMVLADNWVTAAAKTRVGRSLAQLGHTEQARSILRPQYELLRIQLGEQHRDTVEALRSLRLAADPDL